MVDRCCQNTDGFLASKVSCETTLSSLEQNYALLYKDIKNKYDVGELSRFFPMEGSLFRKDSQAVKLMVVGRCVSGWTAITEETDEQFKNVAKTNILNIGFRWLCNDGKAVDTYIRADGAECRYNINKSAFWRCIKKCLNLLDPDVMQKSRWFENIVWSNLYPIAPKNKYNADYNLKKLQLKYCRDILRMQIVYFNPTHILFITDWEEWFDVFSDLFPFVNKMGDSNTDIIIGKGTFEECKVVVTIRPDRTRPFKPKESEFAENIYWAFNTIE